MTEQKTLNLKQPTQNICEKWAFHEICSHFFSFSHSSSCRLLHGVFCAVLHFLDRFCRGTSLNIFLCLQCMALQFQSLILFFQSSSFMENLPEFLRGLSHRTQWMNPVTVHSEVLFPVNLWTLLWPLSLHKDTAEWCAPTEGWVSRVSWRHVLRGEEVASVPHLV